MYQDFLPYWLPSVGMVIDNVSEDIFPIFPACPGNESYFLRSRDSLCRCARDALVTICRMNSRCFKAGFPNDSLSSHRNDPIGSDSRISLFHKEACLPREIDPPE